MEGDLSWVLGPMAQVTLGMGLWSCGSHESRAVRGPLGVSPVRRRDPHKSIWLQIACPRGDSTRLSHANSTPDSVLALHRVPSRNQESESPPAINTCRPHQSWSLKKENATQRMGANTTQRMGADATQRMGANTTQRMGADATQRMGANTTQRMGADATQRMGADATTSSSMHCHSINEWKWSSHWLKSNYFCSIKTKGIQMANGSYSGVQESRAGDRTFTLISITWGLHKEHACIAIIVFKIKAKS